MSIQRNTIDKENDNNSTINFTESEIIGIIEPNIFQINNDNPFVDIEKEFDEEKGSSSEENSYYSNSYKNTITNGILIEKNPRDEMIQFNKVFKFKNNEKFSDSLEEKYLNQKRNLPKEIKTDLLIIDNSKSINEKKDSKSKETKPEHLRKAFISNFLNTFLFQESNKKLEKWLIENHLKYKIYKCNHLQNIGNSIERTQSEFLSKTFKEIFVNIDGEKKEGVGNQIKNKQLFAIIEKNFKNPRQLTLLEEFKKFYESNIEDLLKLYYNSKQFLIFKKKKLKNGKTIEENDYIFSHAKKRKRPSLLTLNGFIKYAKDKPYCHNKRRKIKMNSIHQ